MMTFRVCVQRYQRLPHEIVVDRGPEFGSVYFETLLSRYFMTKKERPAHQPRFGSVIKRLFGTATTEFLNQLPSRHAGSRRGQSGVPRVYHQAVAAPAGRDCPLPSS